MPSTPNYCLTLDRCLGTLVMWHLVLQFMYSFHTTKAASPKTVLPFPCLLRLILPDYIVDVLFNHLIYNMFCLRQKRFQNSVSGCTWKRMFRS